jgi:hypothetical protein
VYGTSHVEAQTCDLLAPFVMPPMRFKPTDPWHLLSHAAKCWYQGFHPRIYLIKAFPQDKSDVIALTPACRWSTAPRERLRANDPKDAGVHVPLLIGGAVRSEETTRARIRFASLYISNLPDLTMYRIDRHLAP